MNPKPAVYICVALIAMTAILFMRGFIYAFVLPTLCYANIVWYDLRGSRLAPEALEA